MSTQIPFCLAVPVLESAPVEEVHQYLGHPVEHTYHRIGLQAQVVAVEQRLGGERHHLAVFLHHGNQTNLLQFGDLALLQIESHSVHLAHGTVFLAGGDLCHPRLVHAARQCRGRRNQQVLRLAEFGITSTSDQVVAGHTYVGLVHIASRQVGVEKHFDDIVRLFKVGEVGINHHLVVMRNLCPFFNNLVGTQISRDNQQGIIGTQVQTIVVGTQLVRNGVDEERVVQVGELLHGSIDDGNVLNLVGIRILVEKHDRTV